ncbi:hypothetical protein CD29_17650 [Ureibacillus manganicus DSM 26584]|uniref:Uncharacterized protein n=1 Tax=Ureibacillus manganicus DSM 26584 TaxID=1384049 RepID=A0A0A3HT92_9BACL|nr:hypothetical protein CD29_17650 [Ureibacillus manganicus DSM 26584]
MIKPILFSIEFLCKKVVLAVVLLPIPNTDYSMLLGHLIFIFHLYWHIKLAFVTTQLDFPSILSLKLGFRDNSA